MKNTFHEFISRLDTVEERISVIEDLSTESSKTKKQREKDLGSSENTSGKNA